VDTSRQVLAHLFASNTDQLDVEIKSQIRLESDVDLLLRLGVDDALGVVKAETFIEDLLYLALRHSVLVIALTALHHLQLDVQVAVRRVLDVNRQVFLETYCDGPEV